MRPGLTELRISASEIFDATLRAVDAGAAVRSAVKFAEGHFTVCGRPIDTSNVSAVAIGKAALAMGEALEQSLGQFFKQGVLTGPAPSLAQTKWLSASRWNWYVGGHPLPNRESLSAAADAVGLLQKANRDRGVVIFLISGGGSAMMEWPAAPNITLSDLQGANRTLVSCGASISEVNSVRRAFSAIKGGKLAARAPECDQITLVLSDVPKNEEFNVASGPSIDPNHGHPVAVDVIESYKLRTHLPATIVEAVENPRDFHLTSETSRERFVLLSNDDAIQSAAAAAKQRGFLVDVATDIVDGPISAGCDILSQRFANLRAQAGDAPVCLISGGEFACPVSGEGVGGRNLETALRLAMQNGSAASDFVGLCAGTDGIDGNSPAAGAIADSSTVDRARAGGYDPEDYLQRSDAYSFFAELGDTIITGPTGTNVRDLRILLSRSIKR
ncbi:MAG TPA: DUF4147 domain-containing protein [Pyrinomonadaceae bacterium]|nr:DUF4147 domain-containing protein [Pyrinomonadaceae bacterium]